MSSFFSSLASKAQSAYEQSPIAGQVADLQAKLQSHGGTTEHPTANEAAAQGGVGAKSRTLGNLTHQLRSLQMQISSVGPVQRIITTQKSVALDFDSAGRDAKAQSKELYMWGQSELEDIKDVTDRLAYLNFIHGTLSETLAAKLDENRSSLKALRDAEKALEPKRNIRLGIQNQIARIEHDQQKGAEKHLAELKQQLRRAEADDDSAEKQVEILKRKAIAGSEKAKWDALREYGEKLVLLAEASTSFISALPSVPPSAAAPYTGAQSTATTRASLQHALDNYKPGSLSHSFQPSAADLNRSDSRSFGVTHATELNSMAATVPHSDKVLPDTPPAHGNAPHAPTTLATAPSSNSPPSLPVNPASLNNTPTTIPPPSPQNSSTSPQSVVQANVLRLSPADAQTISAPMPASEPTIAETGVPVSAGADGPGPASGSLHDLKSNKPMDPIPGYGVGAGVTSGKFESAEEEKKRLQREERERILHTNAPPSGAPGAPAGATGQTYESAEEEKRRLEREERERLLREGTSGPGGPSNPGGSGGPGGPGSAGGDGTNNPPPYQDF